MTVRNGREFLAIPGPTNVPDAVLQAMHRPAMDIYGGAMVEITEKCLADLKTIFRTKGHTYIYAANGHGGWEAALSNVLSRGNTVLVLESGRFAPGWGLMGATMGAKVETLPGSWRRAVDPGRLEERLRADKSHTIKAVLVVQIDTASGVVNDIPAIRKAMTAAKHPALLMVDAVASLATMPFEMDAWGVDVAMSASQKGLMSPPGLAFIAAGERALAAHKSANLKTNYWDWTAREGHEHYSKYCGTPPEHLLFAVAKALDMILAEGLDNVFTRHRLLAEAVRQAVGVWSEGQALSFNASEAGERANSVTTVLCDSPKPLIEYCKNKCGVVLGNGIGALTGKAFRIAHMGHINAPMVLGTLAVTEMGLKALGIPHGPGGTEAATQWLAKSVPA